MRIATSRARNTDADGFPCRSFTIGDAEDNPARRLWWRNVESALPVGNGCVYSTSPVRSTVAGHLVVSRSGSIVNRSVDQVTVSPATTERFLRSDSIDAGTVWLAWEAHTSGFIDCPVYRSAPASLSLSLSLFLSLTFFSLSSTPCCRPWWKLAPTNATASFPHRWRPSKRTSAPIRQNSSRLPTSAGRSSFEARSSAKTNRSSWNANATLVSPSTRPPSDASTRKASSVPNRMVSMKKVRLIIPSIFIDAIESTQTVPNDPGQRKEPTNFSILLWAGNPKWITLINKNQLDQV